MRPRQAERPSLRKAHFASSAFLSSVSALSASDAERGDTPSDGRGNAEREINRLLPNLRDPQAVCDCSRTAHILTQTPAGCLCLDSHQPRTLPVQPRTLPVQPRTLPVLGVTAQCAVSASAPVSSLGLNFCLACLLLKI